MKALLKYSLLLALFTLCNCGGSGKKKGAADPAAATEATTADVPVKEGNLILFFGNSLTAGMGLDPAQAFPAFIQHKLDSLGYQYTVVNAGLSGETTASGRNRLSWVLNDKVEVFILELGANDGLRGIPLQETRANLQAMIDYVRAENPETEIILAGMQIPPNMGPEYTTEFREMYPLLAAKNQTGLIPFLLQDVGGVPELNQQDGIHPTEEGHRIIAANIWPVIEHTIRNIDSLPGL